MASTVQKQWLIALATIGTIVGAFALAIVLTSPQAQPTPPPVVSDQVAASAIYAANQQLIEIGQYVQTGSSNQVDLDVANDLSSFSNDQVAGLKTWAKDNHVELSESLRSPRFTLVQDHGLVQTIISQKNAALHMTFKIYLKQLKASVSQVNPTDIAESMRTRVSDLGSRVDTALTKLG